METHPTKVKGKLNILAEAQQVVHGPRRAEYGTPLDNHNRTASLWNIFLANRAAGSPITASDVCFLNILQKISRCITTGVVTRDTIVDIAGYAANVELIWDELDARKTPDDMLAAEMAAEANV